MADKKIIFAGNKAIFLSGSTEIFKRHFADLLKGAGSEGKEGRRGSRDCVIAASRLN